MSKFLGLAAAALVTVAGCAETRTCSLQVPVTTPLAEYPQLAQVSRATAEQSARERLHAGQVGQIVAANLESAAGCLIWAVKLKTPDQGGLSEVHVDAGDGRVLSVKHAKDSWFYE